MQRNSIVIGFQAVIVILIVASVIASWPSFSNGYPSFGWFFLSAPVFVSAVWIALEKKGKIQLVAVGIALIALIIAGFSFSQVINSDWPRLWE